MHIIVTGGNGFIGKNLVPELRMLGHTVTVMDLQVLEESDVSLDITTREAVRYLEDSPAELLIHLAAKTSVLGSCHEPKVYHDVNVQGTQNLLRGWGDRPVIFASTGGAIYGHTDGTPCKETDELHPLTPYGITKEVGEELVLKAGKNNRVLRLANVYGPHQHTGVIHTWMHALKNHESCTVYGEGTARDYVHAFDVVTAFMIMINNIQVPTYPRDHIYNVGTGRLTPLTTLHRELVQQLRPATIHPVVRKERRRGEVDRVCLDASRIFGLGWHPPYTLTAGLKTL